jgi:thiol-disulfide isomerase/thioredoxin
MQNKRQFFKNFSLASAGLLAAAGGMWLSLRRKSGGVNNDLALWDITLPMPDGRNVDLKTFKGRPLFLNFWATWCAPCVEELPLLNQFYTEQRQAIGASAKSLQMLGIAADKSASVIQFLKTHPIDFPVIMAGFEGLAISKQLGNTSSGLPYSVFIGANGAILFTKEGKITVNELQDIAKRYLSV